MNRTLLDVAHEIAKDIHAAGGMDTQTMDEFATQCLPTVKDDSPDKNKPSRSRVTKTPGATLAE